MAGPRQGSEARGCEGRRGESPRHQALGHRHPLAGSRLAGRRRRAVASVSIQHPAAIDMRLVMRPLRPFLAVFVLVVLGVVPAGAIDIKEVKSKAGITAWLVEDHTNPLIAMQFSFAGGAANDPAGKEGTAHFITAMMDEGAADLDSTAFQARRDALNMKMSFNASFDQFQGSFQTLSEKRDESFALLKLALTKPRFDKEPLDRVRDQLLIGARQN